jgi:hypothetical protein
MESIKNRAEELRQLIAVAKQDALSEEELEAYKDKQDQSLALFLQNGPYPETGNLRVEHEARGVVIFDNLIDFMLALEVLGLSKEEIDTIVSHENDHMNKAESFGAIGKYQIQFCKMPNGKYAMYPSCKIDVSDLLPEDEQRRIWKEIISAPEDLSHRDMGQLGELNTPR